MKQEIDLSGITQTEFKENEDRIVAGIASALKLDTLAVKVLNVENEGSRRRRPLAAKLKVVLEVGCPYTPTDTVKDRMECGSFKKSLCDEIARATKHALKDVVVEDMRTWVEPNDKVDIY